MKNENLQNNLLIIIFFDIFIKKKIDSKLKLLLKEQIFLHYAEFLLHYADFLLNIIINPSNKLPSTIIFNIQLARLPYLSVAL